MKPAVPVLLNIHGRCGWMRAWSGDLAPFGQVPASMETSHATSMFAGDCRRRAHCRRYVDEIADWRASRKLHPDGRKARPAYCHEHDQSAASHQYDLY